MDYRHKHSVTARLSWTTCWDIATYNGTLLLSDPAEFSINQQAWCVEGYAQIGETILYIR